MAGCLIKHRVQVDVFGVVSPCEGRKTFRNVGIQLHRYTAPQHSRTVSESSPPWKTEITRQAQDVWHLYSYPYLSCLKIGYYCPHHSQSPLPSDSSVFWCDIHEWTKYYICDIHHQHILSLAGSKAHQACRPMATKHYLPGLKRSERQGDLSLLCMRETVTELPMCSTQRQTSL
jgi:hypothetical protein